MAKPYVHQPQEGPGHKTVTITHLGKSISIRCKDNEKALALAKDLVFTFSRHLQP